VSKWGNSPTFQRRSTPPSPGNDVTDANQPKKLMKGTVRCRRETSSLARFDHSCLRNALLEMVNVCDRWLLSAVYIYAVSVLPVRPWPNRDCGPAHLRNHSFRVAVSPGATVLNDPLSLSNPSEWSVFILQVAAVTSPGYNQSPCYLIGLRCVFGWTLLRSSPSLSRPCPVSRLRPM
jgi:hypothetical protein